MDEREAIARLKRGDIGGLEPLVRRYQIRAVRAAFLVCRDPALAEDIVQAAFLRAYERIAQFDDRQAFGPWFFRSVVNAAHTAAARAAHTIPLDLDQGDHAARLIDPAPHLDDLLIGAETSATLARALDQLSVEQRDAVVLRYYLGLSEAEMAARLAAPPGTIKWRLHRARQRLRRLLLNWRSPATRP